MNNFDFNVHKKDIISLKEKSIRLQHIVNLVAGIWFLSIIIIAIRFGIIDGLDLYELPLVYYLIFGLGLVLLLTIFFIRKNTVKKYYEKKYRFLTNSENNLETIEKEIGLPYHVSLRGKEYWTHAEYMKSTSAKISITVGALIPVSIVVLGWMFPEDSDERAASEEVQLHQLELKDGLWHHKESGSPHTGKFYELSNSTNLLAEGNLNKGKLHGTYTRWHENGNKLAEKKFEYGKLISEKNWNQKGQFVNPMKEVEKE